MSRVIKFRVWSEVHLCWMDHCAVIDCPGNVGSHFFEVTETGEVKEHLVDMSAHKPIVEQFTGLLDKNGREIYEGDIVKTDPNHFNALLKAVRESERYTEYSAGLVEWWNNGFAVCQAYIGATRISEYASCDCCPCGLEVIGTIHENPDLIQP